MTNPTGKSGKPFSPAERTLAVRIVKENHYGVISNDALEEIARECRNRRPTRQAVQRWVEKADGRLSKREEAKREALAVVPDLSGQKDISELSTSGNTSNGKSNVATVIPQSALDALVAEQIGDLSRVEQLEKLLDIYVTLAKSKQGLGTLKGSSIPLAIGILIDKVEKLRAVKPEVQDAMPEINALLAFIQELNDTKIDGEAVFEQNTLKGIIAKYLEALREVRDNALAEGPTEPPKPQTPQERQAWVDQWNARIRAEAAERESNNGEYRRAIPAKVEPTFTGGENELDERVETTADNTVYRANGLIEPSVGSEIDAVQDIGDDDVPEPEATPAPPVVSEAEQLANTELSRQRSARLAETMKGRQEARSTLHEYRYGKNYRGPFGQHYQVLKQSEDGRRELARLMKQAGYETESEIE